jgi:hypothetical protein
MALISVSTNADAAGTDIMDGERLQTSSLPRQVTRIGFGGSAAIADCALDLFYGSEFVARVYNTTTDDVVNNDNMLNNPGILVCAPNEPIHLYVVTASGSIAYCTMEIAEIMPRQTFRGRGRY